MPQPESLANIFFIKRIYIPLWIWDTKLAKLRHFVFQGNLTAGKIFLFLLVTLIFSMSLLKSVKSELIFGRKKSCKPKKLLSCHDTLKVDYHFPIVSYRKYWHQLSRARNRKKPIEMPSGEQHKSGCVNSIQLPSSVVSSSTHFHISHGRKNNWFTAIDVIVCFVLILAQRIAENIKTQLNIQQKD